VKRYAIFVYSVLACCICFASVVSEEKAGTVAINWAKVNRQSQLSIKSIDTVKTKQTSNLYLVSYQPHGYAIVSMQDFTRPILSWSFVSSILVDDIPDVYDVILNAYNDQINELLKVGFSGEDNDLEQWILLTNNIIEEDLYENQRNSLDLTARWDQDHPYNSQCTFGGESYLVGCGQVAL